MAKTTLVACAVALTLLSVVGCGTVANVTGGCLPFGGVAVDGGLMEYGVATTCGLCEKNPELPGPPGSLGLGFLALLDLPFSAVADVVTLPGIIRGKLLQEHPDEAPKENDATARTAASGVTPAAASQPPSP